MRRTMRTVEYWEGVLSGLHDRHPRLASAYFLPQLPLTMSSIGNLRVTAAMLSCCA
jgi:hypothetical protein